MNIETQSGQTEELLTYYVYVLAHHLQPDKKTVFYVGKGQGDRMKHHWAEAQREHPNNTLTEKQEMLSLIRKSGQEPVQRVIGSYETEAEAFAVESTLIKWVYGFKNLTNDIQGHGAKSIREKGVWKEMAHLEIPKPIGSNDGSYSRAKKGDLANAGAYEFFEDLLEESRAADFKARGFEEKEDKPYDPGESNGVLGALVRIAGVDFLICLRKTLKPKVFVATTQSTREANDLIEKTGWDLDGPKNIVVNGVPRYREFNRSNDKAEFSGIPEFMTRLEKLRCDLESVERT